MSGFHTENLTDFAVPEENPKSVNCLKDMTDSAKKYDEQFFIHATIRKKASSYYETASATYSKQVLNIDWSTIAGVVSGATALAACIYVVSSPTSVAVLGVISAIAAIINSLGGINSCYAKVNINTSDYFNDPVGKDLEEFVGVFYDVCLKRSPDATGLTNWVNGLYNGQLGGGQVGYGFFFSQEYINQNQNYYNYVAELYRAMLHRDGSSNEIGVWTNALGSGYTREQVFHRFENSTEFAALCGNYGITP